MKLHNLVEYTRPGPGPTPRVQEQDLMAVVHDFLDVINKYFASGGKDQGWGTNPKIPVVIGSKTTSIQVRLGVSRYVGEKPNISVETTPYDIELRLDVPYSLDTDWETEKVPFLQLVAAVSSARLKTALQKMVARL